MLITGAKHCGEIEYLLWVENEILLLIIKSFRRIFTKIVI